MFFVFHLLTGWWSKLVDNIPPLAHGEGGKEGIPTILRHDLLTVGDIAAALDKRIRNFNHGQCINPQILLNNI
ncbi:MAG: hypothetical protein LBR79_01080 [Oscillospiraceae bacterium]|nr:hypothetical protein [Oscillospiraceae bacterium]